MLEMMKKAGCIQINFGIETGDENILKGIQKGTTLDQGRRALRLWREVGIKTPQGFIFGFPGETKKIIDRSIKFAVELNPYVALFNVLVPFPGTETFQYFPELHKKIEDPTF